MGEFILNFKKGNIDLKIKGDIGELFSTLQNLKNEFNLDDYKSQEVYTAIDKNKKINNKEQKKIKKNKKINIDDDIKSDWISFYKDKYTILENAGKFFNYETILIVLLWIKSANIMNDKITEPFISELLRIAGNKKNFDIKQAIRTAKKDGNVYIENTENGYCITNLGIDLLKEKSIVL